MSDGPSQEALRRAAAVLRAVWLRVSSEEESDDE
jgi:hypothetical protein